MCPITTVQRIKWEKRRQCSTMGLPVRWSLLLSARIFHVLCVFKQTPSDPGFCRGGLYLEQAFLWSRLPSPHTFFRKEQINGQKGPARPWWGIIFTYCQMEDITRYQDLLSPFIPVALDEAKIWRARLTDAFSNGWSLRVFMCKEENVLLGEFPPWALMATIFCVFWYWGEHWTLCTWTEHSRP